MNRVVLSWVVLSVLLAFPAAVQAESLFRAGAVYDSQPQVLSPRSLYFQPRPQEVGDIITVLLKETSMQQTTMTMKLEKTHTIDENSTSLLNGAVGQLVDKVGKLPFFQTPTGNRLDGLADTLSLPSFNGMDNSNKTSAKGELTRQTNTTQTIVCQVIERMPNGYLIIQGHKAIQSNKDSEDMMVTGVVNPYFVNSRNEISSTQVANLEFRQASKGVIGRQQNDGVINKLYNFLY